MNKSWYATIGWRVVTQPGIHIYGATVVMVSLACAGDTMSLMTDEDEGIGTHYAIWERSKDLTTARARGASTIHGHKLVLTGAISTLSAAEEFRKGH